MARTCTPSASEVTDTICHPLPLAHALASEDTLDSVEVVAVMRSEVAARGMAMMIRPATMTTAARPRCTRRRPAVGTAVTSRCMR